MFDLLYIVLFIVLTGIAVLFVIGCDRIVGPDEDEFEAQLGTRGQRERGEREPELEELPA